MMAEELVPRELKSANEEFETVKLISDQRYYLSPIQLVLYVWICASEMGSEGRRTSAGRQNHSISKLVKILQALDLDSPVASQINPK